MAGVDERDVYTTTRHQPMKKPIGRPTSENVFIAHVPLAYSKQDGPCPVAIHLNPIVWRIWLKKNVLANGHYRLWIMDDSLDDRVIKGITLSFMVIGVNLNKSRSNSPITSSLIEDKLDVFIIDP